MFIMRPEVDWARLREEYRPQALASTSTIEFATVCAEMLKALRDLHVWLTIAGNNVPVFNRPRTANSNPTAHAAILGTLHKSGSVKWAVTDDQIGFIAIYGWNDSKISSQCDEALERMRNTRGLIVDVRLNGRVAVKIVWRLRRSFFGKGFRLCLQPISERPQSHKLDRKVRAQSQASRPVAL